jgi:hypothetical protein
MKKLFLFIPFIFLFIFPYGFKPVVGLEPIDLEYDPSFTESNPFRGFVPFIGEFMEPDDFPHSMEFFYVPLKDLMNDYDSYTFETGLESNIEEIDGRNHQTIFRVYLDYPGAPTGIPDFLLNGLTLNTYTEYGGGQSPDYTNETLISTLEQFIGELGQIYDGDTRIAFIEVGLLGFWGEWHTYPHESWFPDEIIQNRILHAFDNAFNTTQILVRYPTADSPTLNIGFHDDSFAYETIGEDEWVFANLLEDAGAQNRWQEVPIGGEIYPNIQTTMWELIPPSEVQDFEQCVDATHASWMIYDEIFYGSFTSGEKSRARDGALLLGYQFFVSAISSTRDNNMLTINVTLENKGSAPFYYPLYAKIGIGEESTNIYDLVDNIHDINVLPGETTSIYIQIDLNEYFNSLEGNFNVIMQLKSEMTDIPIFLANENSLVAGGFIISSTYPQNKVPWSTGWFLVGIISVIVMILLKKRDFKEKNKL